MIEEFGCCLEQTLKRAGKLSIYDANMIGLGIAKALLPIHNAGIVHRDLKLSNILIKESKAENSQRCQIKICDFGLAQSLADMVRKYDTARVGTLAFQSPEILELKEYSAQSDIWSLGVIFYILVHG